MKSFKILLVGLVAFCLAFSLLPAQAASSFWVENPNLSVEFTQGNDWGKMNANHTELTPRDGECDGHDVMFYLRDVHNGIQDFRMIFDKNGCEVGGGSASFDPYNWDTVKLCEMTDTDGWYCTPVYYLPWGN